MISKLPRGCNVAVELRKQERFLVRLASVRDVNKRLLLLRSWEILPQRIREVRSRIERVLAAVHTVRHSESFRRALHVTLCIGNFLNSGQRHGEAQAFAIDSLNRLSMTKSTLDKRKSLLHLLDQHADLSKLVQEFYCLRGARHIDADELQADIESIRAVVSPGGSVSAPASPSQPDDGFPAFVAKFKRRFGPRIDRLVQLHRDLLSATADLRSYLSMTDGSLNNLFDTLAEFCAMVERLHKLGRPA